MKMRFEVRTKNLSGRLSQDAIFVEVLNITELKKAGGLETKSADGFRYVGFRIVDDVPLVQSNVARGCVVKFFFEDPSGELYERFQVFEISNVNFIGEVIAMIED